MGHYHKYYLGSNPGECGNGAARAKNPKPKKNTVRRREPFGYRKFHVASSRFYKYSNMILTMGPDWIGCHYRTSTIWYPLDQYHSDYNLKDQEVTQAFTVLK